MNGDKKPSTVLIRKRHIVVFPGMIFKTMEELNNKIPPYMFIFLRNKNYFERMAIIENTKRERIIISPLYEGKIITPQSITLGNYYLPPDITKIKPFDLERFIY